MATSKRRARGTVAFAALAWLGIGPARAVIGGAVETGPLSRSTVMVLSSNGGVCSAVVVARDAVLTAAHCVTGAPEQRVHWRDADGTPVLIEPAAKAVHPGYDAGAVAGRRRSIDLALLRLPEPLPARFSVATLAPAPVAAGTALTLGGYGAAREGETNLSGEFRAAALTAIAPHGPSRILVWARGRAGVGACRGDSGGPIAADEAVAAITTWATGAKGRVCGDLTQGVLVGPQRDWIDRTLAAWGAAAAWR